MNTHNSFIQSTVEVHLGNFHFGAVSNNAALNTLMHIFQGTYIHISLRNMPTCGIYGSEVYIFFQSYNIRVEYAELTKL